MQANQITLAVDILNDGNTVNQVYDRFREYTDRTEYNGENGTPEARDMMTFYRTAPTKSGNFRGVKKCAIKFTEDVVVDGVDGVAQLTSPVIAEISFSIPVGTTDAKILEISQRVVAAVDSSFLMDLASKQSI